MEYHQEVSGSMAHYLDALGRVSKKWFLNYNQSN
jgi:hypothetical protein